MKKITLAAAFLLGFIFTSFAQTNPVVNLTWMHEYVMPNNFFELRWDEPEQPHDELIGYNIYREDEFYRFQVENTLHHLQWGYNCEIDYLIYGDQNGFWTHVTAVYASGESAYLQSAFVVGALLGTEEITKQEVRLYPNPTTGIVNIGNPNVDKIIVCDLTGKKINEYGPQPAIDLSTAAKGIYVVKLISGETVMTGKIVRE